MPVETIPNPANQNDDIPLRSLTVKVDEPLYVSLIRQIKETLNPPKLPPLQLTSQPAAVKSIWGDFRTGKVSSMTSLLIHLAVVALLLIPFGSKVVEVAKQATHIYMPVSDYDFPPAVKKAGGGGGGGDRTPKPPPKGNLPKFEMKIQKAPPTVVIKNPEPKLPVQPTVVAPPELAMNVNLNQMADPMSKLSELSNGPGNGGGIGSGSRGGVGSGNGGGVGDGSGGGIGGGAFRVGGGVSAPQLVSKVEPEYSEAARKAKYQGTVTLRLIVQKDGSVRNIEIMTPLGLGLDEKAIEAVKQWRFRPGMKAGQAVDVIATVEVTFRLL